MRRGIADLDGQGEVVSGIIVMRQGENALRVIERVKAKIKEIEPGLPAGMKLVTTYDRSELILASIDNLKHTLIEELDRGRPGDSDLPVARAERPHPHRDHPHRGADLLRPHARHGNEFEHHVAGRHRDRGGRDGGRRHRGGGADAQDDWKARAPIGRRTITSAPSSMR